MRWFIAVSIVILGLSGCPGTPDPTASPIDIRPTTHDWRDHHIGRVKSAGGFGEYLIIQFEDDVCYKVPYSSVMDGDPWSIGESVAMQDMIDNSDRQYWRIRSVRFVDPRKPVLPAEKAPPTRSEEGVTR